MTEPFNELNFLTRSENRVTILKALIEESHRQRDLVDQTDISRVTVSRTLDAFHERGWIRKTDDGFTATPIGKIVAEDYAQLAETMDVACRLGPVVDLLPVERMDFDLRILANATISDPEDYDVLQTVDRWVTLIRESDRLDVFAYRSGRMVAEPIYEEISAGSLDMDAVLAPSELERVRNDPPTREIKQKIHEAGANYYVAAEDPDKPYSFGMFGDIAAIVGWDENSEPQVHLETRDEPVVEWVRAEFEALKADAEPLAVEDLAP